MVCGQRHAPAALDPRYPLHKRLAVTQSWSQSEFIHSFTGAYSPGWTFGLRFRGFLITHMQTHGSTNLDSDQPVAETSTYTGQYNI
jgi:hypothetical protein